MKATGILKQLLLTSLLGLTCHHSTLLCRAQNQTPAPAKPPESEAIQDSLKVFIEEVLIPIAATDSRGRLDPTVSIHDLMLKEDGVLQPLKSVYRIPANVVLLLDTGATENSAKDVRITKVVARTLASSLQTEDRIAVIQVNSRVELVQDWTSSRFEALESIDKKLLPRKDSALVPGLVAAIKKFEAVRSGNSHLVFVTDGIDRGLSQISFTEALQKLVFANVTVHILSYGSMGIKKINQKKLIPTRPREKSAVDPNLIAALPSTRLPGDSTPDLKTIMESKGGVTLDVERVFTRNMNKDQLKQREGEFLAIAEETGGSLWLPSSADEMNERAVEVARAIDSQYVISYKPLRPLSSVTASEYRRIEVASRRVGLNIKARRGYVASRARP